MKYHVIVSGEGHDCQLFVGFEGKPEGDATAADVIAALKATPEARAEVLDALGEPPASRHLDVAAAIARAEQAERSLATVTAERDAAKYWLAAHKAASEALVDPVTGHGFFMLIGKGDDGADGWFYTFGGPLDSYTLCERSDDQDPHFVYFQRERYDHDRGCWIDGCEVVEPVLAPDECSVAPYCLEDVTEERDALKRERDEARAERDSVLDRLAGAREARDAASDDAEALRARLAKTEQVSEERRADLTLLRRLVEGGVGLLTTEEGEATWGAVRGLDAERDALRSRLAKTERVVEAATHRSYVFSIPEWERWRDSLRSAIRALDADTAAGTDSGGSGAAQNGVFQKPEPAGSSRCPRCIGTGLVAGTGEYTRMPCPEYLRGVKVLPCVIGPPLQFDGRGAFDDVPDPEAPATRREVEELRRRVERLESGPRRVG